MPDPVTAYARAVVDGAIVAGGLVRLACQRHLDDLATAEARGYVWALGRPSAPDAPAPARTAWHALEFFCNLRHHKGRWAGQPFMLDPWQQFVVGSLFGWRRRDGTRRFRTAYVCIARKNGKSSLGAGIGLYAFLADGEPGAEVYSAATKRDQARIVWEAAREMVKRSPPLRRRVTVLKANLSVEATASKFEPLSADDDTMDGLNVHAAIVDELHAHKSRGVWDVLETATGAREQPLLVAITTAGFERGVCWELQGYVAQVLEGLLTGDAADATFGYIAALDGGDDWRDEAVWIKANPGLGVSVSLDDLRRKAQKAAALPAAQNNFRCKHMNQWVEQAERWLDMSRWDACTAPIDEAALAGRPCFSALDLSSTTDLTALCHLFPPDGEERLWHAVWRLWVPEERIRLVSAGHLVDRVPYDVWRDQGWLRQTEGNVVDYDVIRATVQADAARFTVREIGYDPWNATQLAVQLQGDGFALVEMRQGVKTLSGPMKYLEGLVLDQLLAHGGHPVLRWMAANVAVKRDDSDNIRPSKALSRGRIDGMVALIMALGRAQATAEQRASVYATRGLRRL